MKRFKTPNEKWLKVIEFAVVGLATLSVAHAEIPNCQVQVPGQAEHVCEGSQETNQAHQRNQVLLFLLKLSFQILAALQENKATQSSNAEQVFWIKLLLFWSQSF